MIEKMEKKLNRSNKQSKHQYQQKQIDFHLRNEDQADEDCDDEIDEDRSQFHCKLVNNSELADSGDRIKEILNSLKFPNSNLASDNDIDDEVVCNNNNNNTTNNELEKNISSNKSPNERSNLDRNNRSNPNLMKKMNSKFSKRSQASTSFLVEDILNPSKFSGHLSSFYGADGGVSINEGVNGGPKLNNSDYLLQSWQPWLLQEALRKHYPTFADASLAYYKPFIESQSNQNRSK